MGRILYCCGEDGNLGLMVSAEDASLLRASTGPRRADAFTPSTKASKTHNGATEDGNVVYTSRHGGVCGNLVSFEHVAGDVGAGHEDRALAVTISNKAVTITFGTDGSGDSVVPTAQEVVDEIAATPEVLEWLTAAIGGDGTGLVLLAPATLLEGGLDNGDWYKTNTKPPRCYPVNTVEVF